MPAGCGNMDRRHFLQSPAGFLGLVSLAQLLAEEPAQAAVQPQRTHFTAKADRCIFIFLAGGTSHIDLFDPKPKAAAVKAAVKPVPRQRAALRPKRAGLLQSLFGRGKK